MPARTFGRDKPSTSFGNLRANCAPAHVPLRRFRASSCSLAATANAGSQWPDLLQPSEIQLKTEIERRRSNSDLVWKRISELHRERFEST